MAQLLIKEGTYYSQSDEDAFFAWLQSIPGVLKVVGVPEGVSVKLRSKRLSENSLRSLLALHQRYSLPMTELAQFETAENKSWFRSPHAYWHVAVFGR